MSLKKGELRLQDIMLAGEGYSFQAHMAIIPAGKVPQAALQDCFPAEQPTLQEDLLADKQTWGP